MEHIESKRPEILATVNRCPNEIIKRSSSKVPESGYGVTQRKSTEGKRILRTRLFSELMIYSGWYTRHTLVECKN
ncbi:hypothetical protein LTR56_018450 [Elasticomyces elasticus]|nr:hypothetical protein LTR56_018450 [Elasticomyces elasticus]KAK4908394.1 hypothetical protein LTR49_022707 [Elasticomyces elasticus]KAK5751722.1 hypothetical protein LTS12_018197 [Elasticomyces elasticus]